MNGAAARWLILARSSGSESELSAVRFSTYSFVGGIHERTLRSRHASLRRTGHRRNRSSPILNYQAPGTRPDFLRYHEMLIIANHILLFLCCERSWNMDLLPDPNVEIIHDQFAEHHIGSAELWAGIEVRDCTNCGLNMSMKNEAMMAGMASLVVVKGETGITYRLRRDNPERLPPGRSASRLPWCTRRPRCSRRHDGLP